MKLKRYKTIYSGSAYTFSKIFKIGGGAMCVLALVAVGWFAYEPIYNLVMGNYTLPVISGSSKPQGGSSSSQAGGEPDAPVSSEAPTPTPTPTPTKSSVGEPITALYMPDPILQNPVQRHAFVAMCTEKKIGGIMFDIKNEKGAINFKSASEKALELQSLSPSAIDLGTFTAELKAAGIKPIGRLYTFKDPVGAKKKDASVKYSDTEWSWLDNSADLGGKPWLNPMSDYAREYIIEIAVESVGMGVEEIIFDGLQFPVGYALEMATYGTPVDSAKKSTELAAFTKNLMAAVAKVGGASSVYMTAPTLIDDTDDKYGTAPEKIATEGLTLGVMPLLFGNVYNSEKLVIESPCKSPQSTVTSAIEALPQQILQSTHMAMLQCYTATNINPLNNKRYANEDVQAQIDAALASGIERVVLYSPSGDYSLLD